MFLGSSASKSGLLTKQVLLRTRKQKFLVYSAVTTSALLAYYTYGLDNKQRRKVKVYTSGVARFARMIKLGVVVVSDFKISEWRLETGLSSSSPEPEKAPVTKSVFDACHCRAAERMLQTGDIWTIKFLMDIAEYWFPGFNFKWAVIELCDTIKQELDFINEGRNAEKCAEDLKGFDYVHVPKVFWEHTSRRVLTTEFIDAVKIDDAEGMKAQGIDIKSACEKMCRVFGYQIFQSGFVHADPHPGNLFVRKHPTKKGDVELVILDHGLYQKVDHIVQTKLGNFWKSMILDDRKSLLMNGRELGVIGLHDTAILAAILLQRPWYVNVPFSSYFKTVTAEDFQHMRGFVENHFNKVMAVLRAIPISLLLVVRNINTIRSIMQTHGEPVNRYRIMTDCTVKRDWTSLGSYLRLQYRLFLMDTKEWMHKMILRLFITLSQSGIPYFTDGLNRLSLEEPQSVLNPS
ncbi:putative aarF domain-containing protein kinase 5 isoform X3 [Convolutriloba macropyga]|uniref:putative aarF domain-containing protein kinase 5 isoform X3 n=1 Tax=Convolutriloba macropyga TaxID=536237 RepID=UPI003F521F0A